MSAALASLPMYDPPFLRAATDAWWAGLARALRAEGFADTPAKLDRARAREEHWRAPDLLLSQTCGLPLVTAFRDCLRPIATPRYAAPGCRDATYRSLIMVDCDSPAQSLADLKGAVAAINGWDSQSGMNVLRHAVAPHAGGGRFFREVKVSGAHLASIALIAAGEADVAAVDCVTHALAAAHAPERLSGVRVLAETAAAPGLPYVTHAARPADEIARLRAALARAMADPDLAAARDDLLLTGFTVLAPSDYEAILDMERAATEAGYPELR